MAMDEAPKPRTRPINSTIYAELVRARIEQDRKKLARALRMRCDEKLVERMTKVLGGDDGIDD